MGPITFRLAIFATLFATPAAQAGQRGIGAMLLADGLAMRSAHRQFPERPIADAPPGWLAEGAASRTRILHDVRAVLDRSDDATVIEFTTGVGPAGMTGEVRYAAWIVTGYLLAHGETETEIAQVDPQEASARVAEAIDRMLAETGR